MARSGARLTPIAINEIKSIVGQIYEGAVVTRAGFGAVVIFFGSEDDIDHVA